MPSHIGQDDGRMRTESRTVTVAAATPVALLDSSARNRLCVLTVSSGASNPAISTSRISAAALGFLIQDTTTPGIRLGAGEPLWVYADNICTFSVLATDLPDGV